MSHADFAGRLLADVTLPVPGLYRRHPEHNLGAVASAIVAAYRDAGPVRLGRDRSLAVIARSAHPGLPNANHQVIAQFAAHGFAGAIKAWLSDDSVTKADLVEAAVACAPVWWT